MHISEGILPYNWAGFWFLAAAPFFIYGLARLKALGEKDLSVKPLAGFLTAVVFVLSCMPIPVPTAGTSSHPCGTGLSGILLGPGLSVIIASVSLLIQALFLAHGGLTTLGANVFSMGVVGSVTGFCLFQIFRLLKVNAVVSAFLASMMADWATYLTTSMELALGIRGHSEFFPLFWKIAVSFIPTQLPLGILEGAIAAGMILLLKNRRPDLLMKTHIINPAISGTKTNSGFIPRR